MYRPKVKLQPTTKEKVLDGLGIIGLIILWVIVVYALSRLPNMIPVHFGFDGKADRYGDKNEFLILPVVITIVFAGLTILNRYPHVYNYPVNLNEENYLEHYRNATMLIRVLKLSLVVSFILVQSQVNDAVINRSGQLATWVLPAILVLILGPVLYFILKSFKAGKK